jgi:hypothetical protein
MTQLSHNDKMMWGQVRETVQATHWARTAASTVVADWTFMLHVTLEYNSVYAAYNETCLYGHFYKAGVMTIVLTCINTLSGITAL